MDINLQAMEKMAECKDTLTACGYQGQELETCLVRLLFCFFADDTAIFPKDAFYNIVAQSRECTGDENGKPLSQLLERCFQVLDLDGEEREQLPEEWKVFPYINGKLFAESLPQRPLSPAVAEKLLSCREIPWRKISPAIFGAMFQEIMNQQKRREWGTYYTSEENILKLIRPLFLDQLWEEYRACNGNRRRLKQLQDKLTGLRFLDPACGCGNFLIVTYQELRRLERKIIEELYDMNQRVLDVGMYCRVNVGQFYGIEYEAFQAQIAQVGMWLADHQMNLEAADFFGMYYARIPFTQSAEIRQGNALTIDWNVLIPAQELSYIIGNPPFVGARLMNAEQKKDLRLVFAGSHTAGNMDYVTAWYRKAAMYMEGTSVRAAFVSTNSICQGEQASLLWKNLKYNYHIGIDFAWRTFVWNNEAHGQAKVHCVIIGFSDWSVRSAEKEKKRLFDGTGERLVPHINAYLLPAEDVYVEARRLPEEGIPPMCFGSMANDGGHLLLSEEEADALLEKYPRLQTAIRPFVGSEEYIKGKKRFCLWLLGVHPAVYEDVPEVQERIARVRSFREYSPREATRRLSRFPELFGEIRQPEDGQYILIPRVSSFRRAYIPMGFLPASVIASDAALLLPHASLELFGLLTSAMHMAWTRAVAGRLKSDYRYSASIVYNNFPFPNWTEEQKKRIAARSAEVLRIREQFPEASLAELYDNDTMPEELRKAHLLLDEEVDRAYGKQFSEDEERMVYLMKLYAKRQ